MMVSRFFFPSPLGDTPECVELPEALAHHAVRVLRLRDGDAVVLFDGSGWEWPGRLEVEGRVCRARLDEPLKLERESPLELVLVQSLASGDKMDWVVQKAVELGVKRVVPLRAERSVLRLSGERAVKRVAHWYQTAISACEQCGRNRVPEIGAVSDLDEVLQPEPGVQRFFLAPEGAVQLAEILPPAGRIEVFVGPEGGWSAAELDELRRARCVPLRLGPRVLRTETAGLAALAAMQAVWGDFSGREHG